MEVLINGFFDYVRVNYKIILELINVNDFVYEIIDFFVLCIVELIVDYFFMMYMECLKLEQVFINLISNVVKYFLGNFKISVSCKEMLDYYVFIVKDNGMGIVFVYYEKIFEFFQMFREKNVKESIGIGLVIVKKIIDEYQEKISVEFMIGEGIVFIFIWKK